MYYLKSRYYDSETGRFINADIISILDESKDMINGLNLFAYCGNNPISYTDPTGESFLLALIIAIAVGAVVGGAVGGGMAIVNGAELGSREFWGGVASGAIMGGAMGAVMTIGGVAGMVALGANITGFGLTTGGALALSLWIGAAAGGLSYLADNGISGRDITWSGVGKSMVSGTLQAAATFGLAYLSGLNGINYIKYMAGGVLKTASTMQLSVASYWVPATSIVIRTLFASAPSALVRGGINYLFGK